MLYTSERLHQIEDDISAIENMVRAITLLGGDDSTQITLLAALEEKIVTLKVNFYAHWRESIQKTL